MNDVENLLREGMDRFTRDLRAPAGMTRRVEQRRRQRRARFSLTGAAALVAGAVALVAVVLPGARDNGTGSAVLAAFVVKRVDRALSAAGPGEIAQMTVTTRRPAASSCSGSMCRLAPGKTATTITQEWSYGAQWRSVTYLSAGHPAYDEGYGNSTGFTLVSYLARMWARQPGFGRPVGTSLGPLARPANPVRPQIQQAYGSQGCAPLASVIPMLFQPGLPGIGFSASSPPATTARALRTAVSCGALVVAGRQRVDGTEAIELASGRGNPVSETISVSPGTYLPMRVVVRADFGGPQAIALTANITWLKATAQNLARLSVLIPAVFRHDPLAEAVGQTLLGYHGGLTVPCPSRARQLCTGGTGPSGFG